MGNLAVDGMKIETPARQVEGRVAGAMRFAPNYAVYLVPPDAVCLYSEHRKFFLRGALYVAIAELIGAGEDRAAITLALADRFPAAKIDEAFRRLIDRRFVVPAALAQNETAAYWASLGLDPAVAIENLQKFGVRIESLGVAGRDDLVDALRGFGVRVVEEEGDLTVALVGDYLDERLGEVNEQRLREKKDWLPVQPTGLFPLVGPIFSPGGGACWRCLSDRMKWNRQVRAFLDRRGAHCVSASPLGDHALGGGGISMAALEIGKAVASGFRTDLAQHIVSLDLLGMETARHYVPARPQCPVCGSPALRDPARAPVPVELRAGGRIVVTSGGYRSMTPAETVARHSKHVSPLTGVVSHLERIGGDQPLDASFVARHNFSPRPETVDALQAGLSGDSYGKGSTAEQGEASALMEAIERYCGIFQGNEIRVKRRFVDFKADEGIHPEEIIHYSESQYARSSEGCCDGAPRRFDPSAEMEWSPVWSLRDARFKYVLTSLLYFFHESGCETSFSADSNGCAAGNTLEEAILQGFLELVERDAYAIWWYNRLRRPGIDLDALGDSYVCDLRAAFAAMGRDVWALDVTNDIGIPAVIAVAHWKEQGREFIEVAAGAHFDPRIATLRAMTELNQFLAIERLKGQPEAHGDDYGDDPLPLRKHPYLRPDGAAAFDPSPFEHFERRDRRDQIRACVTHMARKGFDFLVLDQTRPDIEVPVVRVIVPGLRHFYRRFGPGRLYDTPVTLGLRRRPTRERDLNPLHPRT